MFFLLKGQKQLTDLNHAREEKIIAPAAARYF
jgi:hypothetical protein